MSEDSPPYGVRKKRVGRPPLPPGQKVKNTTVSLPREVLAELKRVADSRGETLSSVVQSLVKKWLAQQRRKPHGKA